MSDHLPVSLSRFPGGRFKALTLSYDDGVKEDRQLVEIFNRFGLRGTFHLNSGTLRDVNHVSPNEVASVYRGHEVSAHSVTHPFLDQLPAAAVIHELMEDRRRLEQMCGYPVRGMSYPFGAWNSAITALLPSLGIRYARTVGGGGNFNVPADFLSWQPTTHHKDKLLEITERFLSLTARPQLQILYVWGHSYEFPRDDNWELIEEFGEKIGGLDDIWYATNIEIADYCAALRRVEFSADFSVALNPTAADLWISAGQKTVRLKAGSRTDLLTGESTSVELWRT